MSTRPDNEIRGKLRTRRVLAWGVGFIAAFSMGFMVLYGAATENMELVVAGASPLGLALGSILTYFFTKRTSEE